MLSIMLPRVLPTRSIRTRRLLAGSRVRGFYAGTATPRLFIPRLPFRLNLRDLRQISKSYTQRSTIRSISLSFRARLFIA